MAVENTFSQLGNHLYMQIYSNLSPSPESFVLAKWSSFPVCLTTVDTYYYKPPLLQECPFLSWYAGICCSSCWQHTSQSMSNLLTLAILLVYSPDSNFILIFLWLLLITCHSLSFSAVMARLFTWHEQNWESTISPRALEGVTDPLQRCHRWGWGDPPTPSNKQWCSSLGPGGRGVHTMRHTPDISQGGQELHTAKGASASARSGEQHLPTVLSHSFPHFSGPSLQKSWKAQGVFLLIWQ